MSIINELLKKAERERVPRSPEIPTQCAVIGTRPRWRRLAIAGILVGVIMGGGVGIWRWLLSSPWDLLQLSRLGQPAVSAVLMEQLADQLTERLVERFGQHYVGPSIPAIEELAAAREDLWEIIAWWRERKQPIEELAAARQDLWELIVWWQERKQHLHVPPGTRGDTRRQTFYVEKRYIESIKRYAEAEGVSANEVVNQAFQQFFEGK
jgi:hypothetical protein